MPEKSEDMLHGDTNVVRPGVTVILEFSVVLDDGTPIDDNLGKTPLIFQHGSNQVLQKLDYHLTGMNEGQRKSIRITPDHAYGSIDPNAFKEVELDAIPEDAREVNKRVYAQDSNKTNRQARIHAIYDDKIMLDFNHPLAGKTLIFDVKVLEVG